MEEKYKNILLQGWMFDCLEFMDKEEQDKYIVALIRSAIDGKVLTDNKKWEYSIEKALNSIEKTREAYYQKAAKIGMKGKEYGIQGKEFGKLGGRPRKGETKEQYAERKKEENAELEKQQEICGMITSEQGLVDFIKCTPQKEYQELIDEYVSKGYTKSQVNKAFEYIRSKNG